LKIRSDDNIGLTRTITGFGSDTLTFSALPYPIAGGEYYELYLNPETQILIVTGVPNTDSNIGAEIIPDIVAVEDSAIYNAGTHISEGSIEAIAISTGIKGWTHNLIFSATDNDTVAWTGGTLTLSDGTNYTINSGTTNSMSSMTYIYFDTTTTLKYTTTASSSVGTNKILVAVAQNVADAAKKAKFQAFGGRGGIGGTFITADNIAANVITANEIVGNTITAAEIFGGTITTTELNFTPVQDTNVIASINTTAEGITINANRTAITSTVDGNTASIIVNATNIGLRVEKDDVINQINISTEGILIDADNITITGATTFTAGWAAVANAESDIDVLNTTNAPAVAGATDDTTADSKTKVFRQDAEPGAGMVADDIWIDTNDGDRPYTYSGAAWVETLTVIDGGKITTGTIDASVVTVANLTATNITTGTLNVDRITAGSIVASKVGSDLTDSNITSIDFDNITATNISADNITAGTLTGRKYRTFADDNERIEIKVGGPNQNTIYFLNSSNVVQGKIGLNKAESPHRFLINSGAAAQDIELSAVHIYLSGDTVPGITDVFDLGSSTYEWQNLYLSGWAYCSAGSFTSGISTYGCYPYTDGNNLGTSVKGWGSLYFQDDQTNDPVSDGEMVYYDDTGTPIYEMRVKLHYNVYKFDLSDPT